MKYANPAAHNWGCQHVFHYLKEKNDFLFEH